MEKEKLKKVASTLISVLIIGWFLAYKWYDRYTTNQTNKFIDAYNSFVVALNSASVAIQFKIWEDGKLKNPTEFDKIISSTKELSEDKCKLLRKDEVEKNCIELFSKYSNIFTKLKEKWFNKENSKELEKYADTIEKFEKDLQIIEWIKFQ